MFYLILDRFIPPIKYRNKSIYPSVNNNSICILLNENLLDLDLEWFIFIVKRLDLGTRGLKIASMTNLDSPKFDIIACCYCLLTSVCNKLYY